MVSFNFHIASSITLININTYKSNYLCDVIIKNIGKSVIRFGILSIGAICTDSAKNGAYGHSLVPMAKDLMAPMVHPIAIGANDDQHR